MRVKPIPWVVASRVESASVAIKPEIIQLVQFMLPYFDAFAVASRSRADGRVAARLFHVDLTKVPRR